MLTQGKITQSKFTSFKDLAREIHKADVQAAQAVTQKVKVSK